MNVYILKPMIWENPYESESPEWHVWLDIVTATDKPDIGTEIAVSKLMQQHSQPLEYYETYLSILSSDGYIEVKP